MDSVNVRLRNGLWQYDILWRGVDGTTQRERRYAPTHMNETEARAFAEARHKRLTQLKAEEQEFITRHTEALSSLQFSGIYNIVPLEWPAEQGVYFVGCVGLVKIGWSAQIRRRMQELQVPCPEELRLLAVSLGGTRQTEADYHKTFDAFRYSGEWFRPAPSLFLEIERLRGAVNLVFDGP